MAHISRVADLAQRLGISQGEVVRRAIDLLYAKFADEFEKEYVNQGYQTTRDIDKTLALGWKLLKILPRSELKRIKDEYLDEYYGG
jgi:V/A-type H+-transporting ATPase subunit B